MQLKANSSNFKLVVGNVIEEYSSDVSKAVYVVADEVSENAVDKPKPRYI